MMSLAIYRKMVRNVYKALQFPNITLPGFQSTHPVIMLSHYLEAATPGSASGQSSDEALFGIGAVCAGPL